ncbi:MAG: M14 family metallopeptidase [Patescibacteria group bacterium]|nr:M14 family metallopeptidase [Patescibacteria group bacterium]
MKNIIIILLIIIAIGLGLYALIPNSSDDEDIYENQNNIVDLNKSQDNDLDTNEPLKISDDDPVIGKSEGGYDIKAYTYGDGDTEILFVGGIHGGYEWNTVILAREAMDYFETNPDTIPNNVKVTIIPVLNPDGLKKVVGSPENFSLSDVPMDSADTVIGRFNTNEVDLNRNFDCEWQTTGTWQNKTVSGGSKAFSESESQAIRDYIETKQPQAVVVWYSAAGGVYSSSCRNGILSETKDLTSAYAKASGYKSYEEFDSYEITGDMVNWLAKENIPAISVLLATHNKSEWLENKAGIESVLKYYKK